MKMNRPYSWSLDDTVKITKLPFLAGLQQFTLSQAAESSRDEKEWHRFLNFLRRHDQVTKLEAYFCVLSCFHVFIWRSLINFHNFINATAKLFPRLIPKTDVSFR